MFNFFGLLRAILLAVLGGGGVLAVVERTGAGAEPPRPAPSAGVVARRWYLYLMAFAGLVATLVALSGLLALLVGVVTLHDQTLFGGDAIRQQAAFYLAALSVGLPIWLGHWPAAQRLAARAPDERAAFERRLFFAAVFAVTAVTALFGLEGLLRFVFTLPGEANARASALGGSEAGARLLVYGFAWWAHQRLANGAVADPTIRQRVDHPHDLAVFVVAAFALGVLAAGLADAVLELTVASLGLAPTAPAELLPGPARGPWTVWGTIVAQVLAAGLVWLAVWRYDLRRGGSHPLRIGYLYLVVEVAAIATLLGAFYGLSEGLRRLFGFIPPYGGLWDFTRSVFPFVLIGGCAWAYHWSVMRRQRADAGAMASPSADAERGIAWPRRPFIAALAFVGLAATALALGATLWVALDALFTRGWALYSAADWWRDRTSAALGAAVIGAIIWLGAWSVWERAAARAPSRELGTIERRLYLAGIALLAALTALGFLLALLWLVLQAVLGAPFGPADADRALQEVSALLLALGIAAYHGARIRADARLAGPTTHRLRLLTVVAPQTAPALATLRQQPDVQLEIVGQLVADGHVPELDLAALQHAVDALQESGEHDRAFLILLPGGGTLYPYDRVGG